MTKKPSQKNKLKVLYQNLGGIWYAFAQNGEDVYFGRVPVNASPEEAFRLLKNQQPDSNTQNKEHKAADKAAA